MPINHFTHKYLFTNTFLVNFVKFNLKLNENESYCKYWEGLSKEVKLKLGHQSAWQQGVFQVEFFQSTCNSKIFCKWNINVTNGLS